MNPNDPTDVGTDVSLCTPLTCRISLLCEEFEFQQFAGLQSSLDTTSASIIGKARLIELLMLCHVFPQRNQTQPLCTEFLFAQHTLSLCYFSSGIHSGYFGIMTTRELVAHVLLPLLQFWRYARRRHPSPGSGWRRLMAGRMSRESSKPVLRS